MIGNKYVNMLDETGQLHHVKEPILSNADIRTMKDNEVLLIYGNKLPLKIKVKPYYKDFLLQVQSSSKESTMSQNKIEYIDINVGVD